MLVRGIAAVALVVVLVVLGSFVGFWGAVGLSIVGVDYSHTYLVLPIAAYAGAAVGLVAGSVIGWRVVRRGWRQRTSSTEPSGDQPAVP